jgi:DNA-3-methyladenine glycosylase II
MQLPDLLSHNPQTNIFYLITLFLMIIFSARSFCATSLLPSRFLIIRPKMSTRKRRNFTTTQASDAEDVSIATPSTSAKRKTPAKFTTPQDIGISELLLGAGQTVLATRAANEFFSRGLTMDSLQQACSHLTASDPRLAPLITLHGPPERLLAKGGGAFASLSKSICFQQLATRAAAVIYGRVLTACACEEAGVLNPASVLATPQETLAAAGLSGRKAIYLHDLARHFEEGLLNDELIDAMNAEELHTALTAVKGLGPWSVDMFCLFHLGLPDILPVGDLGVRKGMQHLYNLKELPSAAQMEVVAEQWKPFRSVGSYYMWRVEVPKAARAKKKT